MTTIFWFWLFYIKPSVFLLLKTFSNYLTTIFWFWLFYIRPSVFLLLKTCSNYLTLQSFDFNYHNCFSFCRFRVLYIFIRLQKFLVVLYYGAVVCLSVDRIVSCDNISCSWRILLNCEIDHPWHWIKVVLIWIV